MIVSLIDYRIAGGEMRDPEVQCLSVSSACSFSLAGHKLLGSGKNFRYQFGRRCFHIDAQQRLCAGYAKQDPWFRPVAVLRSVEEKLYSVEPLFSQYGEPSQAFGRLGARPQDSALL